MSCRCGYRHGDPEPEPFAALIAERRWAAAARATTARTAEPDISHSDGDGE